jgi:cytochrome P450
MIEAPEVIPGVVEEVLRFESPISGLTRTTTRDVTMYDVTIPARARVMVLYGSANRDERAFADADSFDPARQEDRHLAFGHGIHYCLGAALARLEARVAFEELVHRLPHYDIAASERLLSPYIRGFASLTVTRAGPPGAAPTSR